MTSRVLLLIALLVLAPLGAGDAGAADPHAAATEQVHGTEGEAGYGDAHAIETHDDTHGADPVLHGDDAHHGEAHGDDHGGGHHGEHLELPHLIMVLRNFGPLKDNAFFEHWSHVFENAFFAILAGLVLMLTARTLHSRRAELPGRLQAFGEILVEQVLVITTTMMGPKDGKKYAPFVATIFVYLVMMNYSGLVPLGKAPTSTFLNNISIGVCVFLYVQYTGIRRNGLGGYLHHLAGSPKDLVGWMLSPLMFFLEVFGEFVKPVSLSLRLFGNILGEDTLLAVFALLGVVSLSALGSPVGIPLHLPFLFLSLLLGLIQALVFSLLTTVYISLMLPHGDHHEHGEQAHA